MYSGGWAFSNSRKSVKYPPHMISTLPAVQKPLVLRRFCSAYSKNRTKARAAKSEQNRDFMRDQARARAASFPPSISASVPALLLIPFQSNKRRIFRFRAIPSTFKISSQPTPAHTTPAHTPAFRPAVSRPHDPASITRNTTTICTKTTTFICAIFQSKNTCISGYCVVQYRQ